MSLLVDVSITAASIVEAAWARAVANRERLSRRMDIQAVREDAARDKRRNIPWEQLYTTPTPTLYKPDEPVAHPFPADLDPTVLGWYRNLPDGVQIACGNGAASVTIENTTNKPSGPVFGLTTSRAWPEYTATYLEDWGPWVLWTFSHWERRRRISSVQFKHIAGTAKGAEGAVFLPGPKVGVFASKWEGREASNLTTLTADNLEPGAVWDNERGRGGEIFEVITVAGSTGEDPDALFAAGVRRRTAELIINPVPSIVSVQSVTYFTSRYSAAVLTDNAVRSLGVPTALSSKLDAVFGATGPAYNLESGIFMPGYSLSVGGNLPGFGPEIGLLTYAGVELSVRLWSSKSPVFGAPPIPVTHVWVPDTTTPDDFRISGQLNNTVVQGMGYVDINRSSDPIRAGFGNSREGGTPFIYSILNGTYPFTRFEFPDLLADILAPLAPLPPKYQMIAVESPTDPDNLSVSWLVEYYETESTTIPFFTFADVPDNYRANSEWYDIADPATGAPNITGKPKQFKKSLVPSNVRVNMGGLSGGKRYLLATTFGADDFCRDQLAALGFQPADLAP